MQKTVPPLFISFSNWYGFLWPPRKISGCISLAPITNWNLKFFSSKGGPLWKKCVIGAKETHPDILRGGHRNPYQLENAIKSVGTVFLHLSLVYQGAIYHKYSHPVTVAVWTQKKSFHYWGPSGVPGVLKNQNYFLQIKLLSSCSKIVPKRLKLQKIIKIKN